MIFIFVVKFLSVSIIYIHVTIKTKTLCVNIAKVLKKYSILTIITNISQYA